ncbi:hypothetical protein ACLKMH_22040 [Psychromonas sp. KJ10-10]|uniref:hypothetical protein n=1 Tax=Psychromonas sp. KJ10-10 TaxID=3391823 RepID=UPI0039B387AD
MKKLFQTLCVLLAISSQANAQPTQLNRDIVSDSFLLPSIQSAQSIHKDSNSESLTKLYNVKAFQSVQIKQPYSEFELLYQNAIAGQTELEVLSKEIAMQSNSTLLTSGVKSKLRAIDKINSDLSGANEKITDLARTTIVSQDVPTLMDTFALFDQKARTGAH